LKKLISIISLIFVFNVSSYGQKKVFNEDEIIDIYKMALGKKIGSFSCIVTSANVQKKRLPILVRFTSQNEVLLPKQNNAGDTYFNVDLQYRIISIINEVKEINSVRSILLKKYGNYMNSTEFHMGTSVMSCKGFAFNDFCIVLISWGNIDIQIIYNCNKQSFIFKP
jgi:hypothetical protein